MPPAARLGDMHACPQVTGVVPHVGGPILPACAPTVLIGDMPAARVTDLLTCVGPPDSIAMGSPTVLIGNLMAARMGDPTVHGGVIVLGCPTVMIGEVGMGSPVTVLPLAPVAAGAAGDLPPGPLQPVEQSASDTDPGSGDGVPAPPSSVPAPPSEDPPAIDQPPEKTWIGVELRDFMGAPIQNRRLRVVLDKGTTLSGVTDEQGRARFEGVVPDSGCVHILDIPEEQEYLAHLEGGSVEFQGSPGYGPIPSIRQDPPAAFTETTTEDGDDPDFT